MKSRTSWVSRWTRESMLHKEFWSLKKNNKRTTLLFNQSIWKKSHKFVLESNKPPSSKIRILDLSWTVSTFKTPDSNTTTDLYLKLIDFNLIFIFIKKYFMIFIYIPSELSKYKNTYFLNLRSLNQTTIKSQSYVC